MIVHVASDTGAAMPGANKDVVPQEAAKVPCEILGDPPQCLMAASELDHGPDPAMVRKPRPVAKRQTEVWRMDRTDGPEDD